MSDPNVTGWLKEFIPIAAVSGFVVMAIFSSKKNKKLEKDCERHKDDTKNNMKKIFDLDLRTTREETRIIGEIGKVDVRLKGVCQKVDRVLDALEKIKGLT